MGRQPPEPEQPKQAQPPVQPTANWNNQVHAQNGGIGNYIPVNNQPQNLWSSDLFDCMNDGRNALITCLAPCVTFGQIAEIIDEGVTPCATSGLLYGVLCFLGVPCIYSCILRDKMRNNYGLPEAPASDWITHVFCECCALCQEYRELKHRGFDPVIGWTGNVQAHQQEMMAPPVGQRMG